MGSWLRVNAIALLALGVSIIALGRERLLSWLFGPRFSLLFDPRNGADFHLTTATVFNPQSGAVFAQIPCWYVRLRVANRGRSTGEMVELSVRELHRRDHSGTYIRDFGFLPLNLKWAHTGKTAKDRISRDSERYCDLFHILRPGGPHAPATMIAELDLEVLPATGSGQLAPGFYRLVIEVAATNARAKLFTIDLSVPRTWAHDAQGMTQAGFYLSGLPAAGQ